MTPTPQQVRKGKAGKDDDEDPCPVCDQPYAERAIVREGMRIEDLYPGSLFDYLTRYRRRCTAPMDVEPEEPFMLPRNQKAVYFHGDTKQKSRPF